MAPELYKRGLNAEKIPDVWNLENPQAVEQVAREYIQAGSDILITNTFSSNPYSLTRHHLTGRVDEIVEAGVQIARRAAEGKAKVFGNIGPTGKVLMMGEVDLDEVYKNFVSVAKALERGGADAIIIESMSELQEVLLAVRAVRENTSLPVIAGMTFGAGPIGTATIMGVTPAQLVKEAGAAGAGAFAANCGAGPETYVLVAAQMRRDTDAPIWIKPNAGLPVLEKGVTVFPMSPGTFATFVPVLAQAGANFIGGCCGTTPEHIAGVRRMVNSLKKLRT